MVVSCCRSMVCSSSGFEGSRFAVRKHAGVLQKAKLLTFSSSGGWWEWGLAKMRMYSPRRGSLTVRLRGCDGGAGGGHKVDFGKCGCGNFADFFGHKFGRHRRTHNPRRFWIAEASTFVPLHVPSCQDMKVVNPSGVLVHLAAVSPGPGFQLKFQPADALLETVDDLPASSSLPRPS